jgi:hypothetical protein
MVRQGYTSRWFILLFLVRLGVMHGFLAFTARNGSITPDLSLSISLVRKYRQYVMNRQSHKCVNQVSGILAERCWCSRARRVEMAGDGVDNSGTQGRRNTIKMLLFLRGPIHSKCASSLDGDMSGLHFVNPCSGLQCPNLPAGGMYITFSTAWVLPRPRQNPNE